MDPTTTLCCILQNIIDLRSARVSDEKEATRSALCENLRDLADWIEADGFPPSIPLALDQAGYDEADC